MASFRYRAVSSAGLAQQGLVEAPDLDRAVELIRTMGLTPVRMDAQSGAARESRPFTLLRKRVATRDLILFTRQLETMLESGLPILSALETLHEQTAHPELRLAIDRVRADVEQGSTLTEGLRRHPWCFPNLYANLVHAGEEGGMITSMLDRIASLLEYAEETEQRIRSATFYPVLIVCELVLAFGVLVKFVLPRFASLFRNLNTELPLPTRVLIGTSDIVDRYWYLCLAAIAGLIVAWVFWYRTEDARRRVDRFILTMPIFGPIFLKSIVSRFARVLAALVAGGIPIVQALEISRGALDNRVMEEEIDRMKEGLIAGQGLAEPLRGSEIFPPLVTRMLAVGEETGSIDKMLVRVARYYDQDVDYTIKNLSTAIEPVLLLVLGAAVLFTALAVFLPLWNLMNAFRH
jgi:type II secretory pathway component PulF